MWTGKLNRLLSSSRYTVFYFLIALQACSTDAQDDRALASTQSSAEQAWWLEVEFIPEDRALFGKDIVSVVPHWQAATLLTLGLIGDQAGQSALEEFSHTGFQLDVEKDDEQYRVGVYKNRDGENGRFVAVSHDGSITILTEPGIPGFSALLMESDEIRWYMCLQCGEYYTIVKGGSGYYLQ